MTDGRWLNPDEAARYLCVRPSDLRRLVKGGKIPPASYNLGPRLPRYDRLALDAAMRGTPLVVDRTVVYKVLTQVAELAPKLADASIPAGLRRSAWAVIRDQLSALRSVHDR
jgi:hypothetical protein